MTDGFIIKPFKIDEYYDARIENIHPLLVKPPFRWIMIGGTNSGKSTLIQNLVFKKTGYVRNKNAYFDEVYYFIGSKDDALKNEKLILKYKLEKKIKLIINYNDDEMKNLYDDIENDIERDEDEDPRNILFIFDDMILNNISHQIKKNMVDKIFIQGRHINASIIISTQKFTCLNLNMRVCNLSVITIFNSTNKKEIEQVVEDHSFNIKKDILLEYITKYLDKPYKSFTIMTTIYDNTRYRNTNFKPLNLEKLINI
jgi:predicted GIY-YIG superfamily endonuclease